MITDQQLPKRRRPRKQPRQERSQLTVEAILDAAIQIFERHGYAKGTTTKIAERAGIAVGSLYQYYPNKDAILVAVALRHLEESEAILKRLLGEATATTGEPLADLIRRLVEGALALHSEHPALHRMLFEEAALPEAVWRAVADLEMKTASAVAALLQTRNDIHVDNLQLASLMVVQIVEGAVHRLALHPPAGVRREDCLDELVALIIAYLTRNP